MPEMTQSEQTEAELQRVYHALLMIQRTLQPEAKQAVLQARLIGMKQALEAACKIACEDSEEEWTKLRAQLMGAARYHYTNESVDSQPNWRKRRTA